MGNSSTKDQWAGRERLAFIERAAWWRGVVNRGDLREVFGISAAQASADLQGYQEQNPTALAYNVRSKRYEARPEMSCVMHTPRLEEAVGMFLGTPVPLPLVSARSDARVDIFVPPARRADAAVERRIFLALDQGKRLAVTYWSVNSSGAKRREIAPHGLGHDGYRWHVRAWCFENGDFRDFVLSRMEKAEWPGEAFTPAEKDEAWEREVTVVLRANSELDDERRKTIERDYGMKGGKLQMRMREAMKEYCLAHLRVADGNDRPRHLELVE
ncbi:MAG: WYL domain-containing protein [Luteolibacter sp.]|uniref:helix-turn-helix transcriptional regulator n=1 Tax=Luteolibacter sp. TaxID=1962973 RepID=UPI0032679ED1